MSAGTATTTVDPKVEETAVAPPKKAPPRRAIFIGLASVAVAIGAYWYVSHIGHEKTDDAQVDGDVVGVNARMTGIVAKVNFTDNQKVKAGDVLVELDDTPARARLAQTEAALLVAQASAAGAEADEKLAQTNAVGNKTAAQAGVAGAAGNASTTKEQIAEAEAQVVSAQATADRAETEFARTDALFKSGSIPQATLDQARATRDTSVAALNQAKAHVLAVRGAQQSALSRVQEATARLTQASDVDDVVAQAHARADGARAQVAVAKAQRDLALIDLSYTKIVAPQDGVVSKRTVAVGGMVSSGQAIAQLVSASTPWVTANFKETQVAKMKPGQPVDLSIDAYGGMHVKGEVESFAGAAGDRFALIPADNASGNFTKVVQRVPVRIKLVDPPKDVELRPGMNVEVDVTTKE
jgi:membrane fusion protein (multidrug efflux system)